MTVFKTVLGIGGVLLCLVGLPLVWNHSMHNSYGVILRTKLECEMSLKQLYANVDFIWQAISEGNQKRAAQLSPLKKSIDTVMTSYLAESKQTTVFKSDSEIVGTASDLVALTKQGDSLIRLVYAFDRACDTAKLISYAATDKLHDTWEQYKKLRARLDTSIVRHRICIGILHSYTQDMQSLLVPWAFPLGFDIPNVMLYYRSPEEYPKIQLLN